MARRLTMVLAVLGVVALVAPLSGCWLQPGVNAARSSWNPGEQQLTASTVGDLTELWKVEPAPGSFVNAPLSFDGGIFVTSRSGKVARLDASTGATRWALPVTLEFLNAPIWHQGQLLIPAPFTDGGTVFMFDPATGDFAGTRQHPNVNEIATAGGQVAFLSVFSVHPFTGTFSVTWKYTPTYFYGGVGPTRTFAIVGERIQWPSNTLARGYSAACPPQPPESGLGGCAPDWTTDLGGVATAPAGLGDTRVVYGDSSGTVSVLDTATGAVQWTAETGHSIDQPPAVTNDTIFVLPYDVTQGVFGLAALPAAGCGAATCAPRWRADLPALPTGAPVVAGNVVYVPVGSDVLAFAADRCGAPSCPALAQVSAGATITGGPIVDDGRLVVGTEDGHVAAFGLP
jgi:outer membrane protein assembly factor BamB